MRLVRVGAIFLLATAAFAQRGGARGGGGTMGGRTGGMMGGGAGGMGGRAGGMMGGRTGGMNGGFNGGRSFGSPGFGGLHSGIGFRGGYGRAYYGSYRVGLGLGFGFGAGYWNYPWAYGYGYPAYSYYGDPYSYGYPGAASYPYYEPAPVTMEQNYYTLPPAPTRSYSPPEPSEYREPIYLVAFKDHKIIAAIAYWVDGDTLHFIMRDHEEKRIPLAQVDRTFSEQLNRDRHVEFRLPR